jgi:hypothetical protein
MNQVFTVRASSWGGLFDCAFKWQGEHLLGMQRPSGLRAVLGTAVHAGTAAFDEARMLGRPIKADEAAEATIQALHNPDGEVDYKQDKSLTMREAEAIALALHTRYCAEISPLYEFKAVEMKMAPLEIDCGNGVTIRLTGTMDRARVAKIAGQDAAATVIPDIKTGSRLIQDGAVITKGRSAQLGAYQLMYQETTGEEAQGAQIIALPTSGKPEPMVSKIWDARRVMLGTEEAPGFIELASKMFKDGFYPPNPQSPLCSNKFCARYDTCPYHD